jgi:hypothetical protein
MNFRMQVKIVIAATAFALTAPWQPAATALAVDDKSAPAEVTVVKAEKDYFHDEVHVTGDLVARKEVRKLVGNYQVSEIKVQEGDRVQRNTTVLARLTPQPIPGQTTPAKEELLKAPENGIVTRVPTPQVPLFVIAVDDEIEFEAEVGSIDVAKLKVGQDARLVVIETGQELRGRIRLAPAGVDQKQLGKGRVSLTDKYPTLQMGMFVRGIITVATREGISVPSSAISHTGEGSVVNVVRDSVIEKRYVKTGLNMDNKGEGRIEILPCSPCAANEGLKEDELVVANAGSSLREGTRVKPVEASQRRGLRP